ncbi:MAG: zinc ABC transporter substrate-binding protein [Nitrosopumilus sp.]|nr:metal ABC transporter substrate-binding protein [Nitrosopumilus sp.]MBT8251690.1 metal ABC transporter substrate-binding protein [Nitrosopumilus sp.]NND87351.1 zinc ABC transporter substrate-binding protein [Nitrosopumilus sp.]NNL52864.1 zinc ABC transporter substrate-binding protein [Nitrosopumilus sp.]NNM02475.1 zinc ABC transporter substrate-binding protein [Nitrosopumilus sp.]
MNTQTKLTIIAISIVIPITSVVVYGTNTPQQITSTDNSKLQVISSFNPLYEFSQIVGKEKVDVTLLVPVGVEPHDWEPTIKDVQQIQKSNLIVINGIGFENWVDDLVENNYQGKIIDTSNGIVTIKSEENNKEHDEEHIDDSGDPHIWLNPVYAKKQVQNIAIAFSNSDPENGEFYHTNAARYNEKLNSLDTKIRNDLSSCKQDFIAFHDAFSYFADEYDLNQHTIIATTNSHGEVTAKTLENVISIARELNIKIIFSEETTNTKTSQIIANEIGGKVLVLSPLEIVSEDNYISKMTQNLENLKEALC